MGTEVVLTEEPRRSTWQKWSLGRCIVVSIKPLQRKAVQLDDHGQQHQNLDDHGRHFFDPSYRRVVLIDVALNERKGDYRLCTTDMRPASSQRVACDLRKCKQVQDRNIQTLQRARS